MKSVFPVLPFGEGVPAELIPEGSATLDDKPDAEGAPERRPKFPKDNGFLAVLKQRVDAYFQTTGLPQRDYWRMYLKTVVILGWFAASYVLLVFVAQTWWQGVLAGISLAFAMAGIGFNIQHDGGHHAYSNRRWLNRITPMSLDLIGASSYLWHYKHVVMHHTYVNIEGQDTDIMLASIIRISPQQKRRWIHRWQHLYLWVLYGIMASRWHLWGDFKEVITGKMGPHKIPRPKGTDLAVFVGGKLLSIATCFVIPMLFHPVWVVLLFYLGVTALMGLILSMVFQLAHAVEEADFPAPHGDPPRMENTWAVHQVETTVDFAQDNRFLAWYLGGLNFQIEHHLFPRICHIHYPALSKIVRQTCEEYGVQYNVHPTFRAGLASHYRWLKRMGEPDRVPERESGKVLGR